MIYIRFTYRYGGLDVVAVILDAEVVVDCIVIDVVEINVDVLVVVVHSTSQSFSPYPSKSLHSVPLLAGSWTMVRFLRFKLFPRTHSQSDHRDH